MRCPKCGYNSFDHLDSCKKCGKDLAEFKQRYGIRSVLFPGKNQVTPVLDDFPEEEVVTETVAAGAAVAATVGVAAAATTVMDDAVAEPATASKSSDSDDFGFDFMGDSAEDDDLSFDELFEEAAEEEDVEESLEAPRAEKQAAETEDAAEDFAFDLPEDDTDLEDDFGFEVEGNGEQENPKNPFDLPESSQDAGAPESTSHFINETFVENVNGVASARKNAIAGNDLDPEPFVSAKTQGIQADLFAEEPSVEDHAESFAYEQFSVTDASAKEHVSSSFTSHSAEIDSVPTSSDEPELYPVTNADLSLESDEEPEDEFTLGAVPDAANTGVAVATTAVLTAPLTEPLFVAQDDESEEVDELDESDSPSLGSRIIAFFCDLSLLLVVGVAFVVASEAAMTSGPLRLVPSKETLIDLSIPYFLVLFFLSFSYFTLFHFLTGQTPGKMLTSLRVETLEREPLSFGQAFLRSVGGLIQVLPIGLGFLSVLLYPLKRGWNDRLAGTRVVTLKSAPVEE